MVNITFTKDTPDKGGYFLVAIINQASVPRLGEYVGTTKKEVRGLVVQVRWIYGHEGMVEARVKLSDDDN